MTVTALDLNTNQYIKVDVVDIKKNKNMKITHIDVDFPGHRITLKRFGKSVYYSHGKDIKIELCINESELKGAGI